MSHSQNSSKYFSNAIMRSMVTLRNMSLEMHRKGLDPKRISMSGYCLLSSGLTSNSFHSEIVNRIQTSQFPDGGWAGIIDTMWNWAFLKKIGERVSSETYVKTQDFLLNHVSDDGLWGRSQRDHGRIPVSGMMLYLHPEIGSDIVFENLENLWFSEKCSLTYKAAYTLMAFARHNASFKNTALQKETINWLANQQRPDGGFGPWLEHPAPSNVFWTAVATMGLLAFYSPSLDTVLESAGRFLVSTQLPSGVWPYHEIEEGCSWGLLALSLLKSKMQS